MGRLNLDALSRVSWLQDSHIQIAIEDIEKYGDKTNGSTLFFLPSLSHFIKLGSQKDVEVHLNQCDAISKNHIVFMVNDCNEKLGPGEGTHWSFLVYERKRNTWYHMDSGRSANAPHAKQIKDKINKCLGNKYPANTKYVECSCTQQQNGYDCGPLAILFAKNTIEKIARGKSLDDCWVDVDKTHYVRERIRNQLSNKLRYLEKGKVRTSDTMNHRDKDVMVKRKEVCWFYKYKECKSGKKCSYLHPPSVRQKERDRSRDRLFESQDYGRSVNGRHGKRRIPHAPHNTDEYKYRNKYNYGSYRDHANSLS